jgi:hypothetical protein
VATGRNRTDQVLVFDPVRRYRFDRLVDLTKWRWRIERDYQEALSGVKSGHAPRSNERGFLGGEGETVVSFKRSPR